MEKITKEIVNAFNIKNSNSYFLGGTDEATFRIDDVILKKINDPHEANWLCSTYKCLKGNPNFRVPEPILTNENSYSCNGWIAYKYLEGRELKGSWERKLEVARLFNSALSQLTWPSFMEERDDPWSLAHKIVWDEKPLPGNWSDHSRERISILKNQCLGTLDFEMQVIHGDLAGNFLFSEQGEAPAIIDLSPAYGPAMYSEAILVVDVFAWESATKSDINLEYFSEEMIVLATIFRLAVVAEFDAREKNDNFSKFETIWSKALRVFNSRS